MTKHTALNRRAAILLAATSLAVLPATLAYAQEETVIRVLRSAVGEFQPLYIAEEQGLLKERGLKLEISIGGAPFQNVIELQAGRADITMAGAIDVVTAVAQGLPVLATLNVQDHDSVHTTGLLTPPGSPYKTVSDLVGKNLGVPFAGQSIQGLMVYRAFEAAGLSVTDANLVNIPFDTVVETAENGTVDAITPVGLFDATARAKGFVEVPEFYNEIIGTPAVIFLSTKEWVAANEDTLRAFNEAMQEAYEYANAHPEAVRAVDAAQTRQPPEYIANRHIAPFTAVFNRDVWMDMVEDMHRYGLIPNVPAASEFIWEGAPE